MGMESWDWYEQEVSRVRDEAHISMCHDSSTRLYLYYRRGRLVAAADAPSPAYQLATAEPLPSNRDRWGLRCWIRNATRGVPCLPDE